MAIIAVVVLLTCAKQYYHSHIHQKPPPSLTAQTMHLQQPQDCTSTAEQKLGNYEKVKWIVYYNIELNGGPVAVAGYDNNIIIGIITESKRSQSHKVKLEQRL